MSELKFFDNDNLVIGGGDWELAPFKFSKILKIGGGTEPSYIDIIISGTTSVTLTNAISLNYVKLFGGTEQLPETYIDSVTLDGKCEQKNLNLPIGYTQVEYIESSGTQYIDTGIKINQKDSVEVDYCYYMASSNQTSGRIFGARYTSVPRNAFAVGTDTGRIATTTTTFGQRGDTSFMGQTLFINSWFNIKMNPTGFYIDDVSYGSFPITNFETPYTLKLFAFEQSASGATPTIGCGIGRCKSFKIYREDVLIQNLIPCKNSSNEVGFYDTVSDTFLTNAGTGNFVAGATVPATPDNPQDIVCNNGAIKYGKPITLDSTRYYAYISANSNWSYSNDSYSIAVPVTVGQKYKITADPTTPIDRLQNTILRWGFIDNLPPETWKQSTGLAPSPSSITIYDWVRTTPQDTQTIEITATHPYLVIQMSAGIFADNITNGRILLTEQSIYTDGTVETATDNLGNVATAQMLLSVGTYKDTQEVLTGAVTRNVGIKVFDGTETITASSSGAMIITIPDVSIGATNNPINTHFGLETSATSIGLGKQRFGSNSDKIYSTNYYMKPLTTMTVADFKQWLADQYNAGTPVIIVYPLTEPTTETVSSQFLSKEPVTLTGSLTGLVANVVSSSHTTPTPTQPLPINCNNGVLKVNSQGQIYTDGTVETVEVTGQNLLDLANCVDGYYYDANGVYSEASSARLSNFVKVKANETYTVFVYGLKGSANVRVNLFDTNKTWLSQQATPSTLNQYTAITVPATQDGYLAFSANFVTTGSCIDWTVSQIIKGSYTVSTMPEYEPYFSGGQATAEMLLKVGTYQDEQSVINGHITRKVGIKVLDGTENWTKGTLSLNYYYGGDTTLDSNTENELICNQFSVGTRNVPSIGKICVRAARNGFLITPNDQTIDTVAKFKQWLANQYAKGTPVVIVYPISSPTTETVTGQHLTVQHGTNIVEITQASIDGLPLEVSYKQQQ